MEKQMDILALVFVTALVAGGGLWMASRDTKPVKKCLDIEVNDKNKLESQLITKADLTDAKRSVNRWCIGGLCVVGLFATICKMWNQLD